MAIAQEEPRKGTQLFCSHLSSLGIGGRHSQSCWDVLSWSNGKRFLQPFKALAESYKRILANRFAEPPTADDFHCCAFVRVLLLTVF
jgi:hypothetical protein